MKIMAKWNPKKSWGVKIMRWEAYMDIKFNNIIRFVETLIIMVAVFLWVNLLSFKHKDFWSTITCISCMAPSWESHEFVNAFHVFFGIKKKSKLKRKRKIEIPNVSPPLVGYCLVNNNSNKN